MIRLRRINAEVVAAICLSRLNATLVHGLVLSSKQVIAGTMMLSDEIGCSFLSEVAMWRRKLGCATLNVEPPLSAQIGV